MPGCFTQALKKHFEISQQWNVKISTAFSMHLGSTHRAKAKGTSTRQSRGTRASTAAAASSRGRAHSGTIDPVSSSWGYWWGIHDGIAWGVFCRFLNKWHIAKSISTCLSEILLQRRENLTSVQHKFVPLCSGVLYYWCEPQQELVVISPMLGSHTACSSPAVSELSKEARTCLSVHGQGRWAGRMPPHGACWKTRCTRLSLPLPWLERC